MTAVETIEIAQGSVDQLQRGMVAVQGQLDKADAIAKAAENVVKDARRVSKRMLICGAVAFVIGLCVVMVIKKRKRATRGEHSEEILT